jgi:hypothetical protein
MAYGMERVSNPGKITASQGHHVSRIIHKAYTRTGNGICVVMTNGPARHIITNSDGVQFYHTPLPFRQITEIPEYRFNDIRPDDHVIDIGANVGAFCICATRYSPHVVAVEPVTSERLAENILLNEVPVRVIEGALGDGKPTEICWDECRRMVPSYTLCQLIELSGGCDFLKCDCEGAEWLIKPKDLTGIRRLEMELHLPPISGPPNKALLDYISHNYHIEIEHRPCHGPLGLMGYLHAEKRT